MATVTYLVKLKKPSKRKHKAWLHEQKTFVHCLNDCVTRLLNGEKLTSKNVPFPLKSTIKNEAIRRAKKAVSDYKEEVAKSIPVFKANTPISINNQNWDTQFKKGRWYIGFTTSVGKKYLPVHETDWVNTYFPYLTRPNRNFRGTIQLLRRRRNWYVAIPIEISCDIGQLSQNKETQRTTIGIDLGLRHLAVITELESGKRQWFSGKEVGYIRRHFRSLRCSLGKKKAQRAIEQIGNKESRWITDYNRKLAHDIITFCLQFDQPMIQMEQLENIRNTCKTTKQADRTIHSWPVYQLKMFIKQKAAKHHIPVTDIDPYKTSQTCFHCGYVDKRNRYKSKFHCKQCDYACHADLNAAKNIARSTSLAV
ncbi:hypothetical protein DCC39_14750 [Pueribacillus theae]|uniref:Cas12f1-like TNB domain-containing protein n=1 Tax=Pueribacillus theae TaxID=2171751 RepID=A0A2U1JUB4_9BACI|nr:RNA-guided endonuclease TnpB family protein [Pueribacillus theae]PWA08534.1 hypothetical protein DCC39_14750 [Pueribacillus theae]